MRNFVYSPLIGDTPTSRDRSARLILFLVWSGLVIWLMAGHVFWRDEVRALTLATSGSNFFEMLGNVQGEGHPALWYLLLRGAYEIAPYREVLPFVSALVGFAAMALLAFRSPFRPIVIGLILFSFYGAFEYIVVARNYGIAALVMFAIAALYGKVRNTLWFGVLVALLANTNVPSCILAGGLLLFRFAELLLEPSPQPRRSWAIFGGNALIAAIGAWLCFITIYPPFNDGAVSSNLDSITIASFGKALVDTKYGFHKLGFWPPLLNLLMLLGCLSLARNRPALIAAVASFVALKLFFYIVYPSDYRHEMLFVLFLVSLHWIIASGTGAQGSEWSPTKFAQFAGIWALVSVLLSQSIHLINPIRAELEGTPYSSSARLAAMLKRPELNGAILMSDPDTALDAFAYYTDNPLWMLREQRFGRIARLIRNSRSEMTLDDVLNDARRLHQQTGRPVLYLSYFRIPRREAGRYHSMFHNYTTITPEGRDRFLASTQLVAQLRPALSGEHYDVYLYPRPSAR